MVKTFYESEMAAIQQLRQEIVDFKNNIISSNAELGFSAEYPTAAQEAFDSTSQFGFSSEMESIAQIRREILKLKDDSTMTSAFLTDFATDTETPTSQQIKKATVEVSLEEITCLCSRIQALDTEEVVGDACFLFSEVVSPTASAISSASEEDCTTEENYLMQESKSWYIETIRERESEIERILELYNFDSEISAEDANLRFEAREVSYSLSLDRLIEMNFAQKDLHFRIMDLALEEAGLMQDVHVEEADLLEVEELLRQMESGQHDDFELINKFLQGGKDSESQSECEEVFVINPYNQILTKKDDDCVLYRNRGEWVNFLTFHGAISEDEQNAGLTDEEFLIEYPFFESREAFRSLHPSYGSSPSPSPEPFSGDY